MDNTAVVKLVKAGIGEDLVVSSINGQAGHYSLTTDDMIALKKAGVSDRVMGAMFQKNAGLTATVPVSTPAPKTESSSLVVKEVGIYYKDGDQWKEVDPELVNFKTGGMFAMAMTAGIAKGQVLGTVTGKASKFGISKSAKLLIYAPEGSSVTEYQLLRLHPSGNGRQFHSASVGITGAASGAGKDGMTFQSNKIAPRTFELTFPPDITAGEYGLMPPGAMATSNMTSAGGKIYAFHITE